MAITNPNTRTTTTGTVGIRGDLKAQPCFRASFRPQPFVLADNEYAFLKWGEVLSDSIPRQFMVTVYTDLDDDTNTAAVRETGFLTILEDSLSYAAAMTDTGVGTSSIVAVTGTGDVASIGTNNTVEFGYDANGDPDGNPCYYVLNGFTDRTLVVLTRIDAQTEDLEALLA